MFNQIMILSIAVNILLAAIVILFVIKIRNIEKRYNNFMSNFNKNGNVEEAFKNYIRMVNNVNEENKIIKANYLNLEQQVNGCAQNIGIVRYNAFDDVGSELSFAIAILDNNDNGFVINSIYGRTSCNVYAKTIEGGTSNYTLSDEEIRAVNRARDYKKI